jgi:hypothetical protein
MAFDGGAARFWRKQVSVDFIIDGQELVRDRPDSISKTRKLL